MVNAFRITKEAIKGLQKRRSHNSSFVFDCIHPTIWRRFLRMLIYPLMWIMYKIAFNMHIKLIELCGFFFSFTHNITYTIGRDPEILILYLALGIILGPQNSISLSGCGQSTQLEQIPWLVDMSTIEKVCTHFQCS